MAYEHLRSCGAFICKHIDYPAHPILWPIRDEPVAEDESGWQFLCGASDHVEADAAFWSLEEVVALDPTVRSLLDAKPGSSFERNSGESPWTIADQSNAQQNRA